MYSKLIFVLVILNVACAKVNSFPLTAPVDVEQLGEVDYFDVDKLGNVYIVNQEGIFSIYNKKNIKLFEYADQRLGKIMDIDASSPMRILLHLRDQGVVKIVDNTLAELQSVNLYENGKFNNVSQVCRANDNNYWIFDERLQQILKIDAELKILNESNLFKDIGMNNFKPFYMRERNNNLLIADQLGKVLIFDNFGHFIKSFQLGKIQSIHFEGIHFYALKLDGLYKQNIQLPDISKIEIDESLLRATGIKVENNLLYINHQNKLIISKME